MGRCLLIVPNILTWYVTTHQAIIEIACLGSMYTCPIIGNLHSSQHGLKCHHNLTWFRELCDKICHQHVRDDDNSYREIEFDRVESTSLWNSPWPINTISPNRKCTLFPSRVLKSALWQKKVERIRRIPSHGVAPLSAFGIEEGTLLNSTRSILVLLCNPFNMHSLGSFNFFLYQSVREARKKVGGGLRNRDTYNFCACIICDTDVSFREACMYNYWML